MTAKAFTNLALATGLGIAIFLIASPAVLAESNGISQHQNEHPNHHLHHPNHPHHHPHPGVHHPDHPPVHHHEEGGRGGDTVTPPVVTPPAVSGSTQGQVLAAQVEAPVGGVKAGSGGSQGSAVALMLGLAGSLASLGWGARRLNKFEL